MVNSTVTMIAKGLSTAIRDSAVHVQLKRGEAVFPEHPANL